MEHEDNAHFDNFVQNRTNILDAFGREAGGDATVTATEEIVAVGMGENNGIGGKFDVHETDGDGEYMKYIAEVQQSEKLATAKGAGEGEHEDLGNGDGSNGDARFENGNEQLKQHTAADVDVAFEESDSMKRDGNYFGHTDSAGQQAGFVGQQHQQHDHRNADDFIFGGGRGENQQHQQLEQTPHEQQQQQQEANLLQDDRHHHQDLDEDPISSLSEAQSSEEHGHEDKENADPQAAAFHLDLEHGAASHLNPDAMVFVPRVGSNPQSPSSPTKPLPPQHDDLGVGEPVDLMFGGGGVTGEAVVPHPSVLPRHLLQLDDDFVAESPRKGQRAYNMDAIAVPEEGEFLHKADARPHELSEEEDEAQDLSPQQQQQQQLEEQKDTTDFQMGPETSVDLEMAERDEAMSPPPHLNVEQDPMKQSIYIENILNSVQPLPRDEDFLNESFSENGMPVNEEPEPLAVKEMLHVEEKEFISHSPSTEEIQTPNNPFAPAADEDLEMAPHESQSPFDQPKSPFDQPKSPFEPAQSPFEQPQSPLEEPRGLSEEQPSADLYREPEQEVESFLADTSAPLEDSLNVSSPPTANQEQPSPLSPPAADSFEDLGNRLNDMKLLNEDCQTSQAQPCDEMVDLEHPVPSDNAENILQFDSQPSAPYEEKMQLEEAGDLLNNELKRNDLMEPATVETANEWAETAKDQIEELAQTNANPFGDDPFGVAEQVTKVEDAVMNADQQFEAPKEEIPAASPLPVEEEPVKEMEVQALEMEPEVKSPEPEVMSPEPEVNFSEPEVKSPEPEIMSPEPEVMSPEPEITSPEPEVKSPEPEVRFAEPEVKSPEPEVLAADITEKVLEVAAPVAAAVTAAAVAVGLADKPAAEKKKEAPSTAAKKPAAKPGAPGAAAKPKVGEVKKPASSVAAKTTTAAAAARPRSVPLAGKTAPAAKAPVASATTARKPLTAAKSPVAASKTVGATNASRVAATKSTTTTAAAAPKPRAPLSARPAASKPTQNGVAAAAPKPRPASASAATTTTKTTTAAATTGAAAKPKLTSPRTTLTSQLRKPATAAPGAAAKAPAKPAGVAASRTTTSTTASRVSKVGSTTTTSTTTSSTTATKTFTARPAPKTSMTAATTAGPKRQSLAPTSAATKRSPISKTSAGKSPTKPAPGPRAGTAAPGKPIRKPVAPAAPAENGEAKPKEEEQPPHTNGGTNGLPEASNGLLEEGVERAEIAAEF